MKSAEDRGKYIAPGALGLSNDLMLDSLKPRKVADQSAAIQPDPPPAAGAPNGVK
jgi:hypothetical protein